MCFLVYRRLVKTTLHSKTTCHYMLLMQKVAAPAYLALTLIATTSFQKWARGNSDPYTSNVRRADSQASTQQILQNSIPQLRACWIQILQALTRTPRSRVHSREIHPNRSTCLASSTYFVLGTSYAYGETARAATNVQHAVAQVLLATSGQQRLHHECHLRGLRSKQKFIVLQATIICFASIWDSQLHHDGHTRIATENKPGQPLNVRHHGSVLQTNTSCAHNQNVTYAHVKHISWSLNRSIWHSHISLGWKQTASCKQTVYDCLRILRRQATDANGISFTN